MISARTARSAVLLGCAVLAASAPASSQDASSGSFEGVVRDSGGLVLPGVTVVVSGPPIVGQRAATTDTDGRYRFPALPPGSYTVTYELLGHETVRREEVVVGAGRASVEELVLAPVLAAEAAVREPVGPPVVDARTTAPPASFPDKKTQLDGVPSAANLWAVLDYSPGVQMRGHDVGGSHKGQQLEYETFGIRSQNRILQDGVNTTEGTGEAGGFYNFYATDEFEVSALGSDVEMSTPGAQLAATWKSGADELSGMLQGDYVHADLISDNIDEELEERGATAAEIRETYDYHLQLGGPIVADRAWFYVAYSRSFLDRAVSGQDASVATDIVDIDTLTGKVNARLGDRDQLVGSAHWSFTQRPNGGLSLTVPPESVLAQERRNALFKLEWQRTWSDRLSTSILVGHFESDWEAVPVVDPATMPSRIDTATSMRSGAGWAPFQTKRWKPQSTGRIDFQAGGHQLKLGWDWQIDRNGPAWSDASGAILYLDNSVFGRPTTIGEDDAAEEPNVSEVDPGDEADPTNGDPDDEPGVFVDRILFSNVPNPGETDHNRHTDFFVQDVWRVSSRLTLNLGLRVGQQDVYYTDTENDPLQTDIFAPTRAPARDVVKKWSYAPRLGVSFDLTGRGKSLLKAYAGRFYANVGSGLGAANPAGRGFEVYEFLDLDEDGIYDGVQELGELLEAGGGGATRIDPDFELAYSDELSVSLEHELAADLGFRLSFVHKRYRNWWDANVNLAQALNLTEPVTAICSGCPLGLEGSEINLVTIPAEQKGLIDSRIVNVPLLGTTGGENTEMSFTTWQVALTRRFRHGFFLNASFDAQSRDELRSPDASTSPYVADPLGQEWFQNHSLDVTNRQQTQYWTAKLLARYVAPEEIGLALSFRYQSGFPWAPVHRLLVPNVGTKAIFLTDLDENRSEDVVLFDVRLDKSWSFGGHYGVTVVADLYNVFNANAATNFIVDSGSRFDDVIDWLPGRTVKLGLRFEF